MNVMEKVLGDDMLTPEGRKLMHSFRKTTYEALCIPNPLRGGKKMPADMVLASYVEDGVTPDAAILKAAAEAIGMFAATSHHSVLAVIVGSEMSFAIKDAEIAKLKSAPARPLM